MNIQRIRTEVARALQTFAYVEAHPTTDGDVYVKAAMQTSASKTYIMAIYFPDYPNRMPRVYVTNPQVTSGPHRYNDGTICYLHPNMWNPGQHDLTFVLARIAKWLNKHDIWLQTGRWPGEQVDH